VDYNFFDNVKNEKKQPQSGSSMRLILILACVFGGVALAVMSVLAFLDYTALNARKNEIEKKLNDSTYIENLALADERDAEVKVVGEIARELEVAERIVSSRDAASLGIVNLISEKMPVGLVIDNIDISGPSFKISGSGISVEVIAQYEHNLRNSGLFESVSVPSVQLSSRSVTLTEKIWRDAIAAGMYFPINNREGNSYRLNIYEYNITLDRPSTTRDQILEDMKAAESAQETSGDGEGGQ